MDGMGIVTGSPRYRFKLILGDDIPDLGEKINASLKSAWRLATNNEGYSNWKPSPNRGEH